MAHKKAGGSKARQRSNRAGKRLGVKVYGGEKVKAGGIILRQRGAVHKTGRNVMMGNDFTIFATKPGHVSFTPIKGGKRKISVD